jgi:hypothetical protein
MKKDIIDLIRTSRIERINNVMRIQSLLDLYNKEHLSPHSLNSLFSIIVRKLVEDVLEDNTISLSELKILINDAFAQIYDQLADLWEINMSQVESHLLSGIVDFVEEFDFNTDNRPDRAFCPELSYLLNFLFGKYCSQLPTDQISVVTQKCLHLDCYGFYESCKMSDDVAEAIIRQIDSKSILSNCNRIDPQSLEYSLNQYDSQEEGTIIEKLSHYINDCNWGGGIDCILSLSNVLVESEKYELWLRLIDKLKYPCLQWNALLCINDCVKFENIWSSALAYNFQIKPKVVKALLRERWYNLLIDNTINIHCTKELQISQDNKEIEEYISNWDNSILINILTSAIKSWKQAFNDSELVAWCCTKQLSDKVQTEHSIANNLVVTTLKDLTKEYISCANLNTKNGKLSYILFTASAYMNSNNCSSDVIQNYLDDLLVAIHRDDFHWDLSLNERTLQNMHVIAQMLSRTKQDPFQIAEDFQTPFEGYKCKKSQNPFNLMRRECYVLCAIALLIDFDDYFIDKNKQTFFKRIVSIAISQERCSIDSLSGDSSYYPLFVVMENIFMNVLDLQLLDWYEEKIVDEIDDLLIVTRVLSACNSHHSETVLGKFSYRVNKEWGIYKLLFQGYNVQRFKAYEKLIDHIIKTN